MTKPTNIEITDNIGKLDQIKSEIIAMKILHKRASRPLFSKADKSSIKLSAATKTALLTEYGERKKLLAALIEELI